MKMRLVEDWQKFWKWASVQIATGTVVVLQLYEQLPQFQQWIPDKTFHNVMTALVALIILGRVLQFGGKDDPAK